MNYSDSRVWYWCDVIMWRFFYIKRKILKIERKIYILQLFNRHKLIQSKIHAELTSVTSVLRVYPCCTSKLNSLNAKHWSCMYLKAPKISRTRSCLITVFLISIHDETSASISTSSGFSVCDTNTLVYALALIKFIEMVTTSGGRMYVPNKDVYNRCCQQNNGSRLLRFQRLAHSVSLSYKVGSNPNVICLLIFGRNTYRRCLLITYKIKIGMYYAVNMNFAWQYSIVYFGSHIIIMVRVLYWLFTAKLSRMNFIFCGVFNFRQKIADINMRI